MTLVLIMYYLKLRARRRRHIRQNHNIAVISPASRKKGRNCNGFRRESDGEGDPDAA